jgi:hypothetical protein
MRVPGRSHSDVSGENILKVDTAIFNCSCEIFPGSLVSGSARGLGCRRRPGPAGNLKPAKDKSTERIDGIVATIMAIGRAMVAQEEQYVEYSMFFV